jgi:hypothetical protein
MQRKTSEKLRNAQRRRLPLGPDVLERAEAELLVVHEPRVVDAPHVLVAVLVRERVVRVGRFPAVDDEVAPGQLDVAEELRPDVAARLLEEPRLVAVRPVDRLELCGVADLVAEDESDHGRQR